MAKVARRREPKPPPTGPDRMVSAIRRFASPERRRSWKWLFAELLIVFLGVYAAVIADSWRERRVLAAQTDRIVTSIYESLQDLERHDRIQGAAIDTMLRRFESDLRAGRRPIPVVYREPGGERPPHSRFWDALVAAGGAQILPPELLFQLANFVNNMDSFGERYVRYAEFAESEVLPLVPGGAAGFYASDGTLRPEFASHVERLRELRGLERRLVGQASELRRQIRNMETD